MNANHYNLRIHDSLMSDLGRDRIGVSLLSAMEMTSQAEEMMNSTEMLPLGV